MFLGKPLVFKMKASQHRCAERLSLKSTNLNALSNPYMKATSMMSENNNRRSSVLPFDANSSHFALSTPAGGASPCYTSRSLASVAQGDVHPPLPRLSPPDAAQETAAAAISIASNGSIPGWLGELYLRLGPAVVFICMHSSRVDKP